MWPKLNSFGEPGDCCLIRGQRWPHRMSQRLFWANPHDWIIFAWVNVSQLDLTSVTKLAQSFCASWLTASLWWCFQIANNHVKFFAATWHASTKIVGSAKKGQFKLEKSAGTTANNRQTNCYYKRNHLLSRYNKITNNRQTPVNPLKTKQERLHLTHWNLHHLYPGTCQTHLHTFPDNITWRHQPVSYLHLMQNQLLDK